MDVESRTCMTQRGPGVSKRTSSPGDGKGSSKGACAGADAIAEAGGATAGNCKRRGPRPRRTGRGAGSGAAAPPVVGLWPLVVALRNAQQHSSRLVEENPRLWAQAAAAAARESPREPPRDAGAAGDASPSTPAGASATGASATGASATGAGAASRDADAAVSLDEEAHGSRQWRLRGPGGRGAVEATRTRCSRAQEEVMPLCPIGVLFWGQTHVIGTAGGPFCGAFKRSG